MRYWVLILRRNQTEQLAVPEAEVLARFMAWTGDLQAKGALRHVERLKSASEGTTVRSVGAAAGPYARAEDEDVVGIYIVEAIDEDAAHAIARECPIVHVGGSVEVRETDHFPRG